MTAGREAWIDTLRGAAVIGLVALNGRAMLHSQDAASDPTAQGALGLAGTLWWMASDIVLRETTIWLTAGLAGICIAKAAEQRPSEWRGEIRARLVALGAIGIIIATTLWPADRVLTGTIAGALTASSARGASLGAAAVAAAIPPAIRAWRIAEQRAGAAGETGWDMLATTNPTREAWETSGYRGTMAEQVDRRSTRWRQALTGPDTRNLAVADHRRPVGRHVVATPAGRLDRRSTARTRHRADRGRADDQRHGRVDHGHRGLPRDSHRGGTPHRLRGRRRTGGGRGVAGIGKPRRTDRRPVRAGRPGAADGLPGRDTGPRRPEPRLGTGAARAAQRRRDRRSLPAGRSNRLGSGSERRRERRRSRRGRTPARPKRAHGNGPESLDGRRPGADSVCSPATVTRAAQASGRNVRPVRAEGTR